MDTDERRRIIYDFKPAKYQVLLSIYIVSNILSLASDYFNPYTKQAIIVAWTGILSSAFVFMFLKIMDVENAED